MLAAVNNAAVNIRVCVSFGIAIFSQEMPRNGIAGSYGSFFFFFNGTSTLLNSSLFFFLKET